MRLLLIFPFFQANAQIDAGLFRYRDVSEHQIVFLYANDLRIVDKTGEDTYKISSQHGIESYPKFLPDGKSIAFTGNYDANLDVYVGL